MKDSRRIIFGFNFATEYFKGRYDMEKISIYCPVLNSCDILKRQSNCEDCLWFGLEKYMEIKTVDKNKD